MNTKQKVLPLSELGEIVANLKKQGKKIVTKNGAFDLLHVGHVRMLEASKALGDILIIGVNSDSSIKQYKSDTRPIISENDRAEMLAALACVDFVTIYNEPDPRNFLEMIKPDIHTGPGDFKIDEMLEAPTVEKSGGTVVIIPRTPHKSTTSIIEQICKLCGKKS
ncbi:MAG: RfaE, domain II [Candidatus Curtissbacteria bacterium GW2011_GWC1_44_33]|uniref:RfaE, domain II n=1 Tax=Candidatus Curtissbacteria bacterium GW2011_GWC1_44_33 TaxID=1618413 RepID=A0A0G1J7M1_9BACT|nr:MAG: RfaE, domain II [Candidatus Curtissbacteria bacterium GW2011_GWC1_44_33]